MAYLSGFIYWISIPLGGMALLMIGYLAKSSWGLLLRRPMEAAIRTLPLWILLFVPLVVFAASKDYSPYFWTARKRHAHRGTGSSAMPDGAVDKRTQTIQAGKWMIERAVRHETELREGQPRVPLEAGVPRRGLVLFAIWGTMIYFLNKWGRDASDETNTAKVDHALPPARADFRAGAHHLRHHDHRRLDAVGDVAAAGLGLDDVPGHLRHQSVPDLPGVLRGRVPGFREPTAAQERDAAEVPARHGTLMLALTLFWSYTSFSQFMLVWIGNLPEEIPFFLKRSAGGWWYVSAALIALHFALPFLLLLFRDIKLHPVRLRRVAIFLLVICALDVVWWIAPTQPHLTSRERPSCSSGSWTSGRSSASAASVGLVWIWQLKKYPLIPASQVFLLPEGHHEHH